MRQRSLFLVAFLYAFCIAISQDITTTTFGKGMLNVMAKDSTWSVKFAPRIQLQANSNWEYSNGQFGKPLQNFLIRRARLKFDGFAFSPKLKYKIEIGLSGNDISGASEYTGHADRYILDAVVKWNFYENFELWAGQTKLPGNLERLVSSGEMQLVDRSLLNAYFNIDRDLGLQLHHRIQFSETIFIREKISISQGEGRNVITGNLGGHQYTGRIDFLPFGEFNGKGDYSQSDLEREASPKFMLSTAYDFNHNAVKTRSNLGKYLFTSTGFHETDITTIFVDAMFKYQGFSFMGEYALREAEAPIAIEEDGSPAIDEDGNFTRAFVEEGNALNLQAGYLFLNNYEIAARYTEIDLKNYSDHNQYTIGLSKYIVGHYLKIQADFSYTTLNGDSDELEYRLGFDLHF